MDDAAPTDQDAATFAEGEAARRRQLARDGFARGHALGRYIVLEQIGEGGMGVVYAAYDPELHRKVALKLLHAGERDSNATAGRARLVREAQAIAQLSHPNVIHVYDVGTYEDHVFLALEFVDGDTLLEHIKVTKPTWRETLRLFIAAGRGLAAAHAAGLVHRDFKPDNVLMGKDGRVLVTDFGLARADSTVDDPTPMPSPRDSQPLFAPLTSIGSIMGTPGYAAPEALKGATGDARSDQFSFAASLWSALYRKRPYPAKDFPSYKKLLAGGIPEPPESKVPQWVRRAVERGLAHDPTARFPSMDAMLDALTADPAVRRRRWALVGAAIAGVALAIGITAMTVKHDTRPALLCEGADRKLAGVWDAPRREAVRKAFLATNRPFAQRAFDAVAQRFDARTHAWVAMHTEACEATQLRGEQPESVMTLRMACLDSRMRELGQLVDVFAAADATIVERAVQAASAQAPLDDCANVTRLLASLAPPPETSRARVDEIRTHLGRAKALSDAGKYPDATALATHAIADARTINYRPVEAEALVLLGEIQAFAGEAEAADATLRSAVQTADAIGYDTVRARAYAWLVGVVGYDLEKGKDGLVLAAQARPVLDRIGGDGYIEALLESNLGRTYSSIDDYTQMLEHHRKALALRQRLFGEDDPFTANSHNNVGAGYNELGRYADALAEHRIALATRTKLLGPNHPMVAMSLSNVSGQLDNLGDPVEGLAMSEKAIAIARQTLPDKSATIIIMLANRATLLAELERYDDATAAYAELLGLLQTNAPKSPRIPRALAARASLVLAPTGDGKHALADAQQAEALTLAGGAKPNDVTALAIGARARALEALGNFDDARTAYQQAIDLDGKTLGKDNAAIIDLLLGMSRVELARKHPADALAAAERTLALLDRGQIHGLWRARTEATLARAVYASGDHDRAAKLFASARAWYATSPLHRELAQLDAWRAANP